MKTLLFVILPYPSHYLSCFALAKELEIKGYKVIFTGNSPNLQNLVNQNGFEFVPMVYQTEDVYHN